MILRSISHFKEYNYSNELKLYMMNFERLEFSHVCVFPYNILLLVKRDDGYEESYISCANEKMRIPLRQGKFYFIPTGLSVEYVLHANITFYTFHVGLEVSPGIDLFSSYLQMISGDAKKLLKETEKIYAEENEFMGLCRLRKFLLDFFISHWPHGYSRTESIPEEFLELMHYIKIHADADMTVKTLADRFNMTPEAFSRKFHKLTKMTPKEFIVKCLIDKMTSLLCDSNKTIREISQELKFSSEFYLSRFFKRSMNIPPTAYKNMVRGKSFHESV